MIAGFARFQKVENALVPEVVGLAGVDWLMELAPASSPSLIVGVPRHRMLLEDGEWVWPCRSPVGLLPFADDALPALLIRHVFWLDSGSAILAEGLRCLKPGGLLVSVSANPWHRASWKELGRHALDLPAWPRFLMQHHRRDLRLQFPVKAGWRGFVPGIAPLLMVVARKPPRAVPAGRLRLRRTVAPSARAVPTGCRAA